MPLFTMKSLPRILKFLLIAVISIILLLIIAAKIISGYVESVVYEKLEAANLKIDSLDINLLARSVSGTRLRWTYLDDSAHLAPHQIQIARISVKGIGMLHYLLYQDLRISKVEGEDGIITYD